MTNSARRTAPMPSHLLDAAKEAGIDIAKLVGSAELTIEQLQSGLSADEMDRFAKALFAVLPDPAFGLRAGSVQRTSRFGVVGFAAMTSPSFGVALARFARNVPLIWGDHYELKEAADETTVSLHPLAPNLSYQQVKLDFELAGLLSFGRQFMDPALRPLRITVRGPAPSYAARYAEIFQCPVEFDSEHHSITFSRRDLDRPLTSANPQLSPLFEQHAEELLTTLSDTNIAGQVRAALRDMLRGQEPTLASVASVLHLSPRTLQRRLASDKISFRDLLDSVRQELAQQYLRSYSGSLIEISDLLGFSDPNSFFRAFKRWTGTTPHNFRHRQPDRSAASAGRNERASRSRR